MNLLKASVRAFWKYTFLSFSNSVAADEFKALPGFGSSSNALTVFITPARVVAGNQLSFTVSTHTLPVLIEMFG